MEGWNECIQNLPGAHFLQSSEWAEVKSRIGWKPHFLMWMKTLSGYELRKWERGKTMPVAAALILERNLKLGKYGTFARVYYVPKGPLLDWENLDLRESVLADLANIARKNQAIFIKIDPDVILGKGVPGSPEGIDLSSGAAIQALLKNSGWNYSSEQIQFRNTVIIDLIPDEETLSSRLKQKTRYNIRLAKKKGVQIRIGSESDWGELYEMYAETAIRDGFVIREEDYYRNIWSKFLHSGMATPFIAEYDAEPIAGLVLFHFARKAWFVYGMSKNVHRDKMPNYLLQWEAILYTREKGCLVYDLWGAPEKFESGDPLYNVFRFKQGLGGDVLRTLGAWDYPSHAGKYYFYRKILPVFLNILRRKGMARLQSVND